MARRTTSIDPRIYRGLLGPAWRYKIALDLAPRFMRHSDDWLLQTHRYLTMKQKNPRAAVQAAQRYPLVAAAERLNADPQAVATLKLMLVAAVDDEEIVVKLEITAAVLEYWKKIFFDIQGLGEATDWIAAHVIDAERRQGDDVLARQLKLAYCVGPIAARLLCDMNSGIPLEVADRLFARKLNLQLKLDEAAAMPLRTSRQSQQLLKTVAQLELRREQLALEREKLAERCRQARERHQLAQSELQLKSRVADGAALVGVDDWASSPLASLVWEIERPAEVILPFVDGTPSDEINLNGTASDASVPNEHSARTA